MGSADCYEDWRTAALEHDSATEADNWRETDRTRLYDYRAVRSRCAQLKEARLSGEGAALLDALDEGVHGDYAGIGSPQLYRRAAAGTKRLVDEYLDELCESLRALALSDLSDGDRVDFVRRASLSFGRSALLLSGGGVFGNFHAGVISSLLDEDVLPVVISGASAGSLIAAIVGTHRREELLRMLTPEHLLPQPSASTSGEGPLKRFGMSHADVCAHIERLLPDLTFAEAYAHSGIYVNVSVSPARRHQSPRLLNAITTPHVTVRSAVLASCSVAGIYPPAALLARNCDGTTHGYVASERWVDGSISDDVPSRRLARLYAVNHFIVSQVNPLALATRPDRVGAERRELSRLVLQVGREATRQVQGATERYGRRWPALQHQVNGVASMLMQDYRGDVNILPPPSLVRPWRGFGPTSAAELASIIDAGRRAAWPHLERIRNAQRVGRVLDDIRADLEDTRMRPTDSAQAR